SSHSVMDAGPARAANGIHRAAVMPAIAKSVKSRSPSSRFSTGGRRASAICERSPTAVFIPAPDSAQPRTRNNAPSTKVRGIVAPATRFHLNPFLLASRMVPECNRPISSITLQHRSAGGPEAFLCAEDETRAIQELESYPRLSCGTVRGAFVFRIGARSEARV